MRSLLVASAGISLCLATAKAVDIAKSGSGTDLLNAASWGSAAPTSADVAVWNSGSLATGLTLGTNTEWQGVRIAGSAGSNVSVSGAGTLTVGSAGFDLSASPVSATFANAVSLSSAQSWNVTAGRTLTFSGGLSGSGSVAIGGAPASSASVYLTSSFQTVATGVSLSSVTGLAGLLAGGWINYQIPLSAHGYLVSSTATSQVYWLQAVDVPYLKAVKVELLQNGSDIQAKVLAAKYTGSASPPGFNFETGGSGGALATGIAADGYGVFALGLLTEASPLNHAGTVSLSGNNAGHSGNLVVNRGRLLLGLGTTVEGGDSPSRGGGTLTVGPLGVVSNGAAHAIWGGQANTRGVVVNGGVVDLYLGQEYMHSLEMTSGLVTRGTSTNLLRVGSAAGAGSVVTNASAFSATISAPVDLTFRGLSLQVADGAAANDLVMSGAISENTGAGSGAKSLTKSGAGTLLLSGSNSFTGGVVVSAGTVKVGHQRALGALNAAVTAVTVGNGATVDLNGVFDTVYGYTIAGAGVGGLGALVNNGSGLGTGTAQTSNLRLSANATIGGTGEWGVLAPGFGATAVDLAGFTLTKSGSASLHLANATFTAGTLSIAGGTVFLNGLAATSNLSAVAVTLANTAGATLNLNGKSLTVGSLAGGGASGGGVTLAGATLTVGNAASTTYSGVISGAGGLVKQGSGSLVLAGANTFTGNVAVNAGTLSIGNQQALGALVAGRPVTQVVVASGATVDFNGVSDATYGYTIAGTGVGGLGALVNSGSAINTFRAQASNITLSANASIGGTGEWSLLTNGYGATNLDLAGFTLTKTGSNTVYLVNSTVTAGTLRVSAGTLGQTITAISASQVALQLDNAAGAAFTLGGMNLAVGSLSGGGASGGNLSLGAATLTVGGLNASTAYSGAVSGSGSLVKSGTGTLDLGGASTFSGGVSVLGGTLRLSSAAGAGTGAITLGGAGSGDVALLVNNNSDPGNAIVVSAHGAGTATIGTDGGGAGNNPTLFGGNLTLNRATTLSGASSDRTTYTGTLSGNVGTLTIAGGGRTTLDSNANSYVGATVVSAGSILQVNHAAGVLPDGTALTVNGALYLNVLAQETVASLAGSGLVQVHPSVTGAHRVNVAGAASTVFSGTIVNGGGSVALGKSGSGSLALTGANTYTGGTFLSGGTLEFASGSLGSSGTVEVSGGTLRWASGNTQDVSARLSLAGAASLDTNGNDVTLASTLAGGQALTKAGAGILTLAGANSGLSSAWTVAGGTLRAGHAQAFGTGTVRVDGGIVDLNGFSVANVFTLAGGILGGFGTLSASQLDLSATETPRITGTISGTLNVAGEQVDATGGLILTGTLTGDAAVFSGGVVTLASGAVHAPGNSPGMMTFSAGLAYNAGASYVWEVELEPADWAGAQPARGVDYDGVDVTGGNLVIGSGASLEIVLIDPLSSGFSDTFWSEARSFQAVSFTSSGQISGAFTLDATDANLAAAGQGVWGIVQDSNGVALTWTPVPEPSAYGLGLAGLSLALAAARRRRERARA